MLPRTVQLNLGRGRDGKCNNIETLMICYSYFGVNLPSVILRNRVSKFEQKFAEVH